MPLVQTPCRVTVGSVQPRDIVDLFDNSLSPPSDLVLLHCNLPTLHSPSVSSSTRAPPLSLEAYSSFHSHLIAMVCLRSLVVGLVVVWSAVVCWTSATSCHIAKQWTTAVDGRSDRVVPAILPAPHCLLMSQRWHSNNTARTLR